MPSYNKVTLMGHLTRDSELRHTANETAVADVGLAVNRQWVDSQGQRQEEVCFVDVTLFGSQAEALHKYTHKGDPVFIEGYLKLDQWVAQDGTRRSKLRVVAERCQFLPKGTRNGSSRESTRSQAPQNGGAEPPTSRAEDDIPF